MDIFLGKVTQHAMNYAIRSGVSITATYAIRQSAKLLSSTPKSGVRDELFALQQKLQHKIRIISPAIDMIELIAARGNTSLESAVALTKDLRFEIQSLGQRLACAAEASEDAARGQRPSSYIKAQNESELKLIIADIKKLLDRIEDAVPLINLAITTSGVSLSTSLPHTVSPSRLLQASTFLTAGDTQYSMSPQRAVQIGPTFTLTVYMLFAGHNRPQNEEEIRETTWKEAIHKTKVKLRRVPLDVVLGPHSGPNVTPSVEFSSPHGPSGAETQSIIPADARADEYAYQMMMIEDLDDDRVHDFEDDQPQPGPFDDVRLAGIRETIPIHEVSKIFYADTSKVLNIGADAESNQPVLLLKRDVNAIPPRRMVGRESFAEDTTHPDDMAERHQRNERHDQRHDINGNPIDRGQDPWRLPPSLDPEWIAFEVYAESGDSDAESETGPDSSEIDIDTSQLGSSISKLSIKSENSSRLPLTTEPPPPWANAIKTSLSLLELLLRLTSLQQFQQQSHLSITDELLNFFLEESASTGAGGDENYRQALRAEARRRVGWDPYNESPLKRRGEDYQYYAGSPSPQPSPQAYVDESQNGIWSRSGPQTRSMTGMSETRSPSPLSTKHKSSWLKRQDERKGSPLRPRTAVTDEGIGTSPASMKRPVHDQINQITTGGTS